MDLKAKVVVVTGGTSGIGRAAALMLAKRGASVTVIGRDQIKGAEVEAALREFSGGTGRFIPADLSLIRDTRRVVADLNVHLKKIDALILSAGVIDFEASRTSEGLDKSFVINFLHKLVFMEGVKSLLSEARGRVVLVAAAIPDKINPDWANFEGDRKYSGLTAMARLHSASLAIAQSLADRWKSDGIEITAIHPGQVDTGIHRSFDRWPWKPLKALVGLTFVPIERPASLLSWLAFSPEAKGYSGYLFPSVKNFKKHRKLGKDQKTLDRIFKTAKTVLSHVGEGPPLT